MLKNKKQVRIKAQNSKKTMEESSKNCEIRKSYYGSLKGSFTYIGDIVSPTNEDDWEVLKDDESH